MWGSILHIRFNQGVGLNLAHEVQSRGGAQTYHHANSDISQPHDMVRKHIPASTSCWKYSFSALDLSSLTTSATEKQ